MRDTPNEDTLYKLYREGMIKLQKIIEDDKIQAWWKFNESLDHELWERPNRSK